jgi:hypothetical protein
MTETTEVPNCRMMGSYGLRLRFAVLDSGGYLQTVEKRGLLAIQCSTRLCDPSNLLSALKLGSCPVVKMAKTRN